MQTPVFTFVDAVEHVLDWVGTQTTDLSTLRKAKRAVLTAYREVSNLKLWSYYYSRAILQTVAQQLDGTIAYTQTGGAYERVVTLTGSTWPSWAALGILRIGTVDYEIESVKSSTEITLSVNSNPGEDIAAGESYILFKDTYAMPVDFAQMGMIRETSRTLYPRLTTPNDFLFYKYVRQVPAMPRIYTLMSDQNYIGTMALKFFPPPDQAYTYEYMYRRQPRQANLYQYNTGTISSSGTAVTSTNATFTVDMIGSVLRPGTATTSPTGPTGSNPYSEQRIITAYVDAQTLTIDQSFSSNLSGVKYEISDPIDLEANAMYTAFLRRCELEMGMMMNRDDIRRLKDQSRESELLAMESDSRSFDPKPGHEYVWSKTPMTWPLMSDSS